MRHRKNLVGNKEYVELCKNLAIPLIQQTVGLNMDAEIYGDVISGKLEAPLEEKHTLEESLEIFQSLLFPWWDVVVAYGDYATSAAISEEVNLFRYPLTYRFILLSFGVRVLFYQSEVLKPFVKRRDSDTYMDVTPDLARRLIQEVSETTEIDFSV